MVSALFDTSILIDYLNAVPQAKHELGLYRTVGVSVITWIEVLVGAAPDTESVTRTFLSGFALMPLDNAVAQRAVELRQRRKLKLPDAVVWATAQVHNMILVTRNTKDFPANTPGVRIPYRI